MAYELEVKRNLDFRNREITNTLKHNTMKQPSKISARQAKDKFISTCTFGEGWLLHTYIVQLKIQDGNYYKTNKDYSFWLRLNPFHPISYLLIIYMILRGIFTRELDYDLFWHNLTTIFQWDEEEFYN